MNYGFWGAGLGTILRDSSGRLRMRKAVGYDFRKEGRRAGAEACIAVHWEAPSPARWARERLGFSPDAVQTRLLNTSTKRGVLNCTRQWGKSTVAAAKAVYQACSEAGSLTIVVSPTARQSGEFVRKASGFAARMNIRLKGDGDNEISLEFPNGSRIVGLPGSEATVRGFSAVSLLLVDEASRVCDDLYLAVRPMLAVSEGTMWLMSTPYGRRGFFYETWERGGPEWERIRVTAAECPRIKAGFLAEERAAMGERWFRQEYECEFGEIVEGVFDRDTLEGAFSKEFEPLKI
jgi:Terminase large subunit, T4likevirus-type, N-terminal